MNQRHIIIAIIRAAGKLTISNLSTILQMDLVMSKQESINAIYSLIEDLELYVTDDLKSVRIRDEKEE